MPSIIYTVTGAQEALDEIRVSIDNHLDEVCDAHNSADNDREDVEWGWTRGEAS